MMPNRTKKGNVTAQARKKNAALSGGRFPIFDEQSANAAIKLRGHAKPGEQAAIINKAASYAPAAATKARKANRKAGQPVSRSAKKRKG